MIVVRGRRTEQLCDVGGERRRNPRYGFYRRVGHTTFHFTDELLAQPTSLRKFFLSEMVAQPAAPHRTAETPPDIGHSRPPALALWEAAYADKPSIGYTRHNLYVLGDAILGTSHERAIAADR